MQKECVWFHPEWVGQAFPTLLPYRAVPWGRPCPDLTSGQEPTGLCCTHGSLAEILTVCTMRSQKWPAGQCVSPSRKVLTMTVFSQHAVYLSLGVGLQRPGLFFEEAKAFLLLCIPRWAGITQHFVGWSRTERRRKGELLPSPLELGLLCSSVLGHGGLWFSGVWTRARPPHWPSWVCSMNTADCGPSQPL